MPYYYRRGYRRRWRLGRRYRRRIYRRSYARRYVNGSSRSSLRMKCTETFTTAQNAGYGNGATGAYVNHIVPYDGLLNGAVTRNPLYQAYAALYEETKLIGMKVNLSVTSAVGGQDTPSLQIYTSWDRRHGYGEPDPTVAEIQASSTSAVATALNNNVAKLSRSIYASDLMEKAQWHDSSMSAADTDQAWVGAAANPNFFCPAFFWFFNSPSLGAVHSINYSVSVTYYVAFRNPKFGGSSSSKDLPARSVTFADEPVDDGDMDDGAPLVEEDDPFAVLVAARRSAGAAQAAAAGLDDPAPLERRQRSAASQAAGNQPRQKTPKKNVP